MNAMKKDFVEKIKILAVEDSPTQAEKLRFLLDMNGYDVTLAKNGRQAMGFLEQLNPSLIITDINMPEVNGFELCQYIKTTEKTKMIPVVLLTSLSTVQDVVDSLICGADSFITKPYNEDYLLKNIERMLETRPPELKPRPSMEVRINLAGNSRVITTNPDQTVSLLLSTFEAAMQRNNELKKARDELWELNECLEEKVKERTGELSAEIVERKQAEAEIQHRITELEVVYSASLAITSLLEPGKIGKKLLDILSDGLHWDHSLVHIYNPLIKKTELLALHQPGLESETDYLAAEEQIQSKMKNPDQGLAGWVIQNGKSIYCGDLTREKRYIETWPGMYSGIYLPLKSGEHIIGCLSIESERENAFTETDEWLFTTLAAQASSALENGRLFSETQSSLRKSQALREIDMVISGTVDLDLVLEIALKHILTELGSDAAIILLKDFQKHTLVYRHGKGLRTKALLDCDYLDGNCLAVQVEKTRETIQIPDLLAREGKFSHSPAFSREGFINYTGIPLIAKGEVEGVLEIFNRVPVVLDQPKLDFLEAMVGQVAIAIDNATIYQDLQESNRELSLAYDATIEGWSNALDLRDKETEGHTQRVTELTLKVTRAMGIPGSERIHIRRGALLHDIGKMGVPDNILLKPGPLTDEEWIIMRKHPQFALDMLSKITYLQPALDIPYCHHEKWDGSGYPRGLEGKNIPLAARIFSVIDVWDALTSDRPYRKAWTNERALEYIKAEIGTHFDPDVIEPFLKVVRSI